MLSEGYYGGKLLFVVGRDVDN